MVKITKNYQILVLLSFNKDYFFVREVNKKQVSLKNYSSGNKNWFCQLNLEDQRKSYINRRHKYTDQNYRQEDSVFIYLYLWNKKQMTWSMLILYVMLMIENIFWVSNAKLKGSTHVLLCEGSGKNLKMFSCWEKGNFIMINEFKYGQTWKNWPFPLSFSLCSTFKGCVCYTFTSLFCMSKRKDLWNTEKCFMFYFKGSFCSWDNQILNFQIFKCHDVIKIGKHETRNMFYWITWEANTAW